MIINFRKLIINHLEVMKLIIKIFKINRFIIKNTLIKF
jgi:hypothetical protein